MAGQQQRDIVSVVAAGPGGENGVAAAVCTMAVWHQRQTVAAGRSRPGMIIQRVARVFMRVREPVVLTFAAMISEVGDGVGDRRGRWPRTSFFFLNFVLESPFDRAIRLVIFIGFIIIKTTRDREIRDPQTDYKTATLTLSVFPQRFLASERRARRFRSASYLYWSTALSRKSFKLSYHTTQYISIEFACTQV